MFVQNALQLSVPSSLQQVERKTVFTTHDRTKSEQEQNHDKDIELIIIDDSSSDDEDMLEPGTSDKIRNNDNKV